MASRGASGKALPARGKQLPLLLLIQHPLLCASTQPESHPLQPHAQAAEGQQGPLHRERVKKQRQDKEGACDLLVPPGPFPSAAG